MQAIKKILVVIEPDAKEQPALIKALSFAKHQRVTLHLLSCLYYPSVVANNLLTPHQLEKTKSAIIQMNKGRLNTLIKHHKHTNVTFETDVIWYTPTYQSILSAVNTYQPELLIKATHQHDNAVRHFITPTDYHLLKACPVPVFLVKEQPWSHQTCIAAAIAPEHALSQQSELDKNILNTSYQFSLTLDMTLHAIHCFDPSYWDIFIEAIEASGVLTDVFPSNTKVNSTTVLDQLRDQSNQTFAKACSEIVPRSEHQHLISGPIVDALPGTLERLNTGILVLGTTYRTGFLGSTAQKLLERVNCDILAIKPNDFDALRYDRETTE